jgi:transcriptional regulator GlxA family with amidase domain
MRLAPAATQTPLGRVSSTNFGGTRGAGKDMTASRIKTPRHERPRSLVRLAAARLAASLSQRVSMRSLADSLDVSERHLRDAFVFDVGCPPSQYLRRLRIERAKQLLRDGMPIKVIATEVGFVDTAHLSRNFKKIVGMTPAQFARKG